MIAPASRFAATLLALGCAQLANAQAPHGPVPATVSACFVPAESCTVVIVAAIAAANHDIRVQAYGFTSAPILGALAAAFRRGVDVQVLLDRTNETGRYSGATYMEHAGIPVWIDDVAGIAHSKVLVIDGQRVITGSFNLTRSADTKNVENVVVIDGPEVARWYTAAWDDRRRLARPYEGQVGH